MAFLNPIFLLGAMAAALPVLVHLVRRTRAIRVQYPSLMFLRRIEQKTIRKRKLRNLALLALRCAALLLLALAFARPYFTGQNPVAAAAERPGSVILLDVSYSMRYGDVFERARQAARNILDDATPGEQVALVTFARNYEILRPLKADRAEAVALLDNVQPGYDASDYLQAVAAADAILKEAGQGSRKIHLVSDFQLSGWNRAAPPVKLSPGVRLLAVDVSDAAPHNVAVTEIKAEPVVYAQKYNGKIAARVNNFGAQPLGDAAMEFKLNDLTVERRQVKLDPATSEIIEFIGFNVPEGSNRATVEITGDNFNLDNRYCFTIRRENQARVLAIETAVRGRSESFFLQQSLLAGENNQHALTLKTAGAINPSEIDPFRAVIVNDVSEVSDALASAITGYVERGGKLILAAGKHTVPATFNRAFGGVSPAEIGETVQTRSYALMSQVKTDHPIFSAFLRGGRLTSTRVYAYHRAVPKEDASVIAALDDGSPVILERAAGKGKVLLVATTLDTAWNDLPLTPMYVPLVHGMLEYLGGSASAPLYTIGQVFTAPADADGTRPLVESPAGGRVEGSLANPAGEQSVEASEVGFYRLKYRSRLEHAAVNLDTRDSDFTKLNVDEFLAAVASDSGRQEAPPAPVERLTEEEIEARQRLWLPLLLLSLALFVGEAIVARRIRIAKLIG